MTAAVNTDSGGFLRLKSKIVVYDTGAAVPPKAPLHRGLALHAPFATLNYNLSSQFQKGHKKSEAETSEKVQYRS